MQYRDRRDAGRQLAEALGHLADDVVVLALPRGGVPVAHEVATALRAPLDVLVVRKVGAPGHAEYGIGAVGEEGVLVLQEDAMRRLGLGRDDVQATVDAERTELERRVTAYRGGRPGIPVEGRTVVVVDDGLATGVSASAALEVLRERGAAHVVLAVPVGAPHSIDRVRPLADEVVCPHQPRDFMAVGSFYRDFGQTSDEEVIDLLARANDEQVERQEVTVDADGVPLPGLWWRPPTPRGAVVFAHGSGSSRHSSRNQHVARLLNATGFATLLFDLLTDAEARDRTNVFDIDLLARRLAAAAGWLRREQAPDLPVGLFGASTGAAAALSAAVDLDGRVDAVVSRGGRPDLCPRLAEVDAPVLLVVGGQDHEVLRLNRDAAEQLSVEHELAVVDGATHLFEEPGTLDEAARLAGQWFVRHL